MNSRVILLGLVVLISVRVHAGTLVVTSIADSGPGSLRDAIALANPGDTIQFDATLNGQAIRLSSGQLLINKNLVIQGPGLAQLSIERASKPVGNFRIFAIVGHTVTIQGLTIRGGFIGGGIPGGCGSGVLNDHSTLTITNCAIVENRAYLGWAGGICNYGEGGSATVVVSGSTISGNTCRNSGCGIYNDAHGGGNAVTVISNSTVGNNPSAVNGAGVGIGNDGYNTGTATVTITNSTISGDPTAPDGGGITNWGEFGNATMTIEHSTLHSAGGMRNAGATLRLGNNILQAGSSGINITNDSGTVDSLGYNLSSDDGGGFLTASGDLINTDPILGPLRDNGGPTLSHELLPGSPAIGAGDPNFSPPPDYDQRGPGFARVYDERLDIGSFELQPTPTPGPTGTPTPAPTVTPPPVTRLLNISTRLRVLTADKALIGGFIVSGNVSKRVIVRAIGPSLTSFGVPDPLADPVLELHGPAGFNTVTNDNWRSSQAAEIQASGLAPSNDLESAIVALLPPGAYTGVVRGTEDGIGVGLVEAYDLDSAAGAVLANISTRGFVDSGDNAMIGGFILGQGSPTARVLIRAIGPSLSGAGVPDALADPTLELHDGNGTLIASNDNWKDTQEAEIQATGIAPTDDHESAIIGDFPPGGYTAVVQGKDSATGVGLIEAYQLSNTALVAPVGPTKSRMPMGYVR